MMKFVRQFSQLEFDYNYKSGDKPPHSKGSYGQGRLPKMPGNRLENDCPNGRNIRRNGSGVRMRDGRAR